MACETPTRLRVFEPLRRHANTMGQQTLQANRVICALYGILMGLGAWGFTWRSQHAYREALHALNDGHYPPTCLSAPMPPSCVPATPIIYHMNQSIICSHVGIGICAIVSLINLLVAAYLCTIKIASTDTVSEHTNIYHLIDHFHHVFQPATQLMLEAPKRIMLEASPHPAAT